MKTIFVTIFEGIEGKNILRTPVVSTLLEDHEVTLVCLTKTKEKIAYYHAQFTHPRIIFEYVPEIRLYGLDKFLASFRYFLLNTPTTRMRAEMWRQAYGTYPGYLCKLLFHWSLARRLVRRMVRYIDFHFVKNHSYDELFERHHPRAVVAAQLFDEIEVHLIRAARKYRVPSIGLINTWDKVTARSALRLLPDTFIVYNSIVKSELMEHGDVAGENIFVAGIPQYDQLFDPKSLNHVASLYGVTLSKEYNSLDFFHKNKLDPDKRLILYAPMGTEYSATDWDVIDMLHELITTHVWPDTQLFVRFPPNDFLDDRDITSRPWLRNYRPGHRFTGKRGPDWDMNFDDLESLTATLASSAVLICYASSISIDAAVMHLPVINLEFELRPTSLLIKSPTRFYALGHYRKALATGGIRLVHSRADLVEAVQNYLASSKSDAEGRARLVREQCEFTDGKAGRRIGEYILARLG